MQPEDRKFQMFIWREDPRGPLKYYQFTYATRSAPYLATKCLEKIGQSNETRYLHGAQFMLENSYVVDGIGGDDNLQTAIAIQTELKNILNLHGLRFQKWTANHQRLLQVPAEEQQEINFDFNEDDSQTVKSWV